MAFSSQISGITQDQSAGVGAAGADGMNISEDNEGGVTFVDERSTLPIEETPEWEEGKHVQEEYSAIEHARARRIEEQDIRAKWRESTVQSMVPAQEVERRQQKTVHKRARMATNIILFDALAHDDSPGDGTRAMWDPAVDGCDDDVTEELEYGEHLLSLAEEDMHQDTSMYMIPEPWYMGDRTRRSELCGDVVSLEQYISQEERLIYLMEERLDYLRKGRSKQQKADINAERKGLECALLVHKNGESNNEALMRDFLRDVSYYMYVDIHQGTSNMRAPDGTAVTDSFSPFMIKFIRNHARLNARFDRIQDLEIS